MATITLKNVPEEVHAALKRQAKLHKRSLNQEAIVCIEKTLHNGERDPLQILAEIRKLRVGVPKVSLEFIENAINQGRE
jgi:plasmid stability protein